MVNESDWTRKYKRALLERNPALQIRRIIEAREAMTRRSEEIERTSRERQVIHRALGILATLRVVHRKPNS